MKVICSAEAPPNQLFVATVDDVNVFDMDANRALMDDLGIHAVSGIFFSFLSVHSLSLHQMIGSFWERKILCSQIH